MFIQPRFLTHLPSFPALVFDLSKFLVRLAANRPNEKRGHRWPRNSWNLFHFYMLLGERKVYLSGVYFSRHRDSHFGKDVVNLRLTLLM